METTQLQQQLFRHLKETLPPHLSLVDELCQLLDLSSDSVYRRIRGEKPVTLTELKVICEHYRLSLDQLLSLNNESVLFQAPGILNPSIPFATHMRGMLEQFKYFNSFKQREIFYLCKDAPFWYFYLFPGIAAFKTFFWMKTINNEPGLSTTTFSLEEHGFHECFAIGQQILEEHSVMNTVELWNLESIHSTINQIAYYREAGIFRSQKDLLAVVDSFVQMLDHLQAQAVKGAKFMPAATEVGHKGSIQFYVNELILGNNTILLNLDNKRLSMVTYSVFSYLITQDERFATKAFDTFNTLLGRSSLVSRSGEKERNRFFNTLRDKVNQLR
ncbi:helix-turn-helix domain-containing protein [Paraflavitalea sp. CAU 1676]|uniref:helix-turn-helix domain-containing protein n=1 Tax=Paraflavitalea sp. CAU 1676 TaxID=3032598 RepID=UPI0023DAD158|nr:helix-turn-helix domain-containing protein [Paraflavitalea sp. CAU 1676]MDF2190153.1 helix-turn-helix domain-containing protein [Paraflavitalea sp. CAU 1676]